MQRQKPETKKPVSLENVGFSTCLEWAHEVWGRLCMLSGSETWISSVRVVARSLHLFKNIISSAWLDFTLKLLNRLTWLREDLKVSETLRRESRRAGWGGTKKALLFSVPKISQFPSANTVSLGKIIRWATGYKAVNRGQIFLGEAVKSPLTQIQMLHRSCLETYTAVFKLIFVSDSCLSFGGGRWEWVELGQRNARGRGKVLLEFWWLQVLSRRGEKLKVLLKWEALWDC